MPPRRPTRAKVRRGAAVSPTLDWLRLLGIQAYGHLGVTLQERELGQRVDVDVELAYAPTPERRPDVLDACYDYEEVSRLIRAHVSQARCRLAETLAEELALALLAEFDPPRVRVRLRKLHVPVADFSGIPEIVVERVRS
jgi:dihydroneopterin aldolase